MKKRRLFGVLLIVVALIIMTLPVSEADAASSASDFVIEGGKLLQYKGTDKNVSIPDTVEVITDTAFEKNTKIESLVISDSVKRIEAYAFWDCDNLKKIKFGKGLKNLSDFAFTGCKGLKQVVLPSTVKSIGIQTFGDCVNLEEITIPAEVRTIHDTAFDGCMKLKITCEPGTQADAFAQRFYQKQQEYAEYEDVPGYDTDSDEDGNHADSNEEKDTQVTIPDETTGNVLGSTHIVGNRAFVFLDGTKLETIESDVPVMSAEDLTETYRESLLTGKSFPKLSIVDGVIVADQAYYRNDSLKKVKLPNGIEEVGEFAFARSSIQKIYIPDGVKKLSYGAFYHCDNLEKVELPESIETVEPKVFEHTKFYEDFLQSGEQFLISGCTLIAYNGKEEKVVIPAEIKIIAADVFKEHKEIKEVVLPENLQVIGEGSFSECTGLERVQFGSKLTDIKDRAFYGCSSLKKVELPASVKRVGILCFDNIDVLFGGEKPQNTYESSATRLSNEAYRKLSPDDSESGVTVTGYDDAIASLTDAKRSYQLEIKSESGRERLQKAWLRSFSQEMPEAIKVYELTLTDSGDVPLKKLGKSRLKVVLPLSDVYTSKKCYMVTLDRNGQLETLAVQKVKLNGKSAVQFETNFTDVVGLFCYGEETDTDIKEITESIQDLSGPEATTAVDKADNENIKKVKRLMAGALLLTGIVLIGSRKKDLRHRIN